jgi:hypothetical protein
MPKAKDCLITQLAAMIILFFRRCPFCSWGMIFSAKSMVRCADILKHYINHFVMRLNPLKILHWIQTGIRQDLTVVFNENREIVDDIMTLYVSLPHEVYI